MGTPVAPYLTAGIWQRCARVASPLSVSRLAVTCKSAGEGARSVDVWERFSAPGARASPAVLARLGGLASWQRAHLRDTTAAWDRAGAQWQRPKICDMFRCLVEAHEFAAQGYVINVALNKSRLREDCLQEALPMPEFRLILMLALPLAIAHAKKMEKAWREAGEVTWADGCLQRIAEFKAAYAALAKQAPCKP